MLKDSFEDHLLFEYKSEKIFKESGLYYLPMKHENRSQLCEEEGQEISR